MGHVGGTIDTNLPYDSNNKFLLTLTSIHSYISGSGKNRSRRERARWQGEVVAHTELCAAGTRLVFRFDVASSQSGQDAVYDKAIRELVRVTSDGLLKTLTYPMGRNIVSNAAAILIGATFAACGWFLIVQEGQGFFGSVFGGDARCVATTSCVSSTVVACKRRAAAAIRFLSQELGLTEA